MRILYNENTTCEHRISSELGPLMQREGPTRVPRMFGSEYPYRGEGGGCTSPQHLEADVDMLPESGNKRHAYFLYLSTIIFYTENPRRKGQYSGRS
jgi:hypothetical protein